MIKESRGFMNGLNGMFNCVLGIGYLGGKQSNHLLLEKSTYIVVGTPKGKGDLKGKSRLNGKNLYVLFLSNWVIYSLVQLPRLNDVVGIIVTILTYSLCWEIVLLCMDCHKEDQLAFENQLVLEKEIRVF
jgi:D-alanyl-lipoteichoic acid acyltransferase DltB (MBOAT superfamily)